MIISQKKQFNFNIKITYFKIDFFTYFWHLVEKERKQQIIKAAIKRFVKHGLKKNYA